MTVFKPFLSLFPLCQTSGKVDKKMQPPLAWVADSLFSHMGTHILGYPSPLQTQ